MYIDITNPHLTIFDGATGDYIGTSHFNLPYESKLKLLNLLNYNQVPDTLTLENLTLPLPIGNYIPPQQGQKLPRNGILMIDAIDAMNGAGWKQIPLEIRVKYDVQGRGNLINGIYDFSKLDMSGIRLVDQRRVEF